ncbi:hypothetical protein EYF80_035487 [Liparis tanakae]|uniref:Uncharacterized protein n=1 Tax=Liparis tanakae TaxID=230148 RepID=A0A4Z2GLC8_9TELE|nr:hypothetical protein EYF80_035487 [Liparis tanakae]
MERLYPGTAFAPASLCSPIPSVCGRGCLMMEESKYQPDKDRLSGALPACFHQPHLPSMTSSDIIPATPSTALHQLRSPPFLKPNVIPTFSL